MPINNSSALIRKIKEKPENFYLIHYSCQSLNDDNEGLSPRITSIAVSHFSTEQSVSFSTHAIAEELGITRNEVIHRFDDVERELLQQFFNFVSERRSANWIHWNMRNATYGFEHLAHRFRVLGQANSPVIPVEQRINLNDMIADRYGASYAGHPKMQKLMELNGGIHRNFLSGNEEVQAFVDNEFMRLHMSTLCKVGFFHSSLQKVVKGTLKTNSKRLGVNVDRLLESRAAKVTSLLASTVGIVSVVVAIGGWF